MNLCICSVRTDGAIGAQRNWQLQLSWQSLCSSLDLMALTPELVLYLAVHKDDFDCIKKHGEVPLRYTSPKKSTIELCEKMEDALERYSLTFGPTPRASLAVLRLVLTPLDIAYCTTANCGVEHDFRCKLSKKIWRDGVDYGVWCFIGALPLRNDLMMSMRCPRME